MQAAKVRGVNSPLPVLLFMIVAVLGGVLAGWALSLREPHQLVTIGLTALAIASALVVFRDDYGTASGPGVRLAAIVAPSSAILSPIWWVFGNDVILAMTFSSIVALALWFPLTAYSPPKPMVGVVTFSVAGTMAVLLITATHAAQTGGLSIASLIILLPGMMAVVWGARKVWTTLSALRPASQQSRKKT